jgi:ATP-dependent DNA helicase RecG
MAKLRQAKMGTGITKMRKSIAEAGLPQVEFDTFFTVTFTRQSIREQPSFTETFGVSFGVKGKKLERLVKILETLYKGEVLVDTQIAQRFQVSIRTVENDIKFLRENGIITFVGPPKTGRYELTTRGKSVIKDLSS